MSKPIDFYYSPTPNGWKISIMLEECELPYNTILMDLKKGDQFQSDFLRISPNNRMPAIVDYNEKSAPVTIFESGAILLYLAEKTGKFIPNSKLGKKKVMEWLFWQVGNLGPMGGQHSHFWNYAPESEKDGYAANRYAEEYDRCFEVLERQLEGQEYIVNEYSIADIISWPWVLIAKAMGRSLDAYPNVTNWRQRVKERPAVRKGVDLMRAKS
ncbi:MAG: thiol:disulfide oxidoreductase [Rhodobacteraceae bacterium]|jgi:GST-like protein|nr:MAG: thiol:disulfide oxidoreductase [Paracoccaceae bacterium]|tara:strand:- start:238 stop:876 length:639 start_codon:yes stop_codon:yes gene_type:complete